MSRIEEDRVCKSLDAQLNDLKALDPNKLRDVLSTVTEDHMLSDLLVKLVAAKQVLVTITNNHAPGDGQIKRIQSTIQELNHQIDDRVAGLMLGLETELKAKQAGLEAMKAAAEKTRRDEEQEHTRGQPYWDAKSNLVQLLDLQKLLLAKVEAEKLNLNITGTSLVQITDYAFPSAAPVKPNKPLCLVEGGLAALLFGALSGWVAVWRGRRGPGALRI